MLVVDDPGEAGDYDAEWVVVLDDWVDGTGQSPDDVLAGLRGRWRQRQGMGGMGGMDHGSMGGMGMGGMGMGGMGEERSRPCSAVPATSSTRTTWSTAGCRQRPSRCRASPASGCGSVWSTRGPTPRSGGARRPPAHHHPQRRLPVAPVVTDALLIGMGERFDVLVTLGDGAFPLVASAEGKSGQGLAVVRTAAGPLPAADVAPLE